MIDYPSELCQSVVAEMSTTFDKVPIDIAESALPSTAETSDAPSAEIAINTAETHSAEAAIPTAEISPPDAETSLNLATPSCSHVLIGRLLIPVSPADFSGLLLIANQLHGFKTVHDLMNEINRGPPRWNTKKQALGLLYNAETFSIGAVQEGAKEDGLSCVIDSTKVQISSTLEGYSAVANVQSSEHLIGTMKVKGIEMDWFEVRGRLWSRRRLVLRGG